MGGEDDVFEVKGRITEVLDRGSAYHVRYREDGDGLNGAFSVNKGDLRGAFSEAHNGRKITVSINAQNIVSQVDVGSRVPGISHTILKR